METMRLYQIEQNYVDLVEKLIDNEGELTPEIEQSLAEIKTAIEKKGENIAYIVKSMDYDTSVLTSEIDRLRRKKLAIEKSQERLKEYLGNAMQIMELGEIKTPLIKINFRKSEAVEITDEEKLPSDCVIWKRSINKIMIKQKIKTGEYVPGAKLVEHSNLQIK